MAAFQNLNNNDYEEFVNSVVKDVTENNLFWSDDDKKLCYNHWLTIHAEQLKKCSLSDRAPHLSTTSAENDTEAVDDEKKRRLNELLAVSDSQIIETTKRRKHCPLKCAQYLAKQCKYECTFVQKQKAVLQKNLSSTLSRHVFLKRSTNAVKATNNTVKSLVELSKATTKYALLQSQLVAAKKFTAAKTVSHSLELSGDAETAKRVDASSAPSTDSADHRLGKLSVTHKTVEYNLFEAHRGFCETHGTIL